MADGIAPTKNPLTGFRKAEKIGAGPSALQESADSVLSKLIGVIGGMTGLPTPDTKFKRGIEVLAAGIPFSAPLGKVFHGTPANIKNLETSYSQGFLPQFSHFAEQPNVAETFANARSFRGGSSGGGQNLIPAKLDVKNALDLTQSLPYGDYEALRRSAQKPWMRDELNNFDQLDQSEKMLRIENILNRDPDFLKRAGFDQAIKYSNALSEGDIGWAAHPSLARTPWGIPLGNEKPIQKFYRENPMGEGRTTGHFVEESGGLSTIKKQKRYTK